MAQEKKTNSLTNNHQNRKEWNKLINDNRHSICKSLNYSKTNCDTIHMNYNQIFNNSTFDNHNLTKFSLFHQNISGIYKKTDDFLLSLPPKLPQISCITEHHLKTEQVGDLILDQYILGTAFCRQEYRKGGACIYVLKDIEYNTINLEQYNKEKDLEICAL